MKFLDEGVKEDFIKMSTPLHVACSYVDSVALEYYVQAEIVFVDDGAVIQLDTKSLTVLLAICERVNLMFKQRLPTCYPLDFKYRTIKCKIENIENLENLM